MNLYKVLMAIDLIAYMAKYEITGNGSCLSPEEYYT